MESCTSVLGAFCVDRAGVRFNDRASDGESHSQAFCLGRKELLKQAASRFRRNADTVIAHADANSAISILLSSNFDFTRRYRGLRHSFESIHDKINQALSGAGIARNSCKRLIQFVRNGRGHLAYQRNTTQMTELVASLLGFEFRLFSSGNIDADSQQLGGFAMGIKAHTSTRRHPAHDSIRENEPILGIKVLALMNRVVDRLSNAIAIAGMQSRNKMLQGDFSGSRPSQEGPPRIGRPDLIFA